MTDILPFPLLILVAMVDIPMVIIQNSQLLSAYNRTKGVSRTKNYHMSDHSNIRKTNIHSGFRLSTIIALMI